MVFRNAVELIYEKCAKRVSDKVQESSLKLDEIYKDNPKVISLIQNNRRDQTHNRYLMTDTALEHLFANWILRMNMMFYGGMKMKLGLMHCSYLSQWSKIVITIQILIPYFVHMFHMHDAEHTSRFFSKKTPSRELQLSSMA